MHFISLFVSSEVNLVEGLVFEWNKFQNLLRLHFFTPDRVWIKKLFSFLRIYTILLRGLSQVLKSQWGRAVYYTWKINMYYYDHEDLNICLNSIISVFEALGYK